MHRAQIALVGVFLVAAACGTSDRDTIEVDPETTSTTSKTVPPPPTGAPSLIGEGTTTSTPTPTTPTRSPQTTVSPTTAAPNLSGFAWSGRSSIPDDVLVFGVTAHPDGFLATGQLIGHRGDQSTGAAMFSADGTSWDLVSDFDPNDPAKGWLLMDAVTEGPKGFVSIGKQINEECMAAWVSPDGLAWTRAPKQAVFGDCGSDDFVTDITANADRYVAVGYRIRSQDWPDQITAPGTVSATIWTSRDGQEWTRLPAESGVLRIEGRGLIIEGIAHGPEGFVAVGRDCLGMADMCAWGHPVQNHAAIWRSSDGTTWHRVDLSDHPSLMGPELSGVAFGPEGYIAVGKSGAWRSADGLEWELVLKTDSPITAVASSDSYYAAAEVGAVWVSTNGAEWNLIGGDQTPAGSMLYVDLAITDKAVVGVGCVPSGCPKIRVANNIGE